ncbi:hypothetical protein LCGC14_2202690 [marine sediment metagenome]|uniref:Uncharacterized protein n=1 Tax=marine sediment metagenome TaxID=412755 RepID=A0A0F9GC19_9ZZZZ
MTLSRGDTVECSDCKMITYIRSAYCCYFCKRYFCNDYAEKHFKHGLIEEFRLKTAPNNVKNGEKES